MRSFVIFLSTIFLLVTGNLLIKSNPFVEILEKKKINVIELINHNKISKDYFYEKLSIKEGHSFWRFNPFKLKRDLENFNEIKNFSFNLNWSGTLQINIEETKPFMIWVRDEKVNYLDLNGRILKFNINDSDHKIIKLYGNNAYSKISELNNILVKKEKTLNNINSVHHQRYIGWKIIFHNKKCVLLPLKKLEKTFDIFQNILKSQLYKKFNYFDLRVFGRVYMNNKKC